MKVKELIKILNRFDKELDVFVEADGELSRLPYPEMDNGSVSL